MKTSALSANSTEATQEKTNRFLLTALPLGHLVNDWPGAALWLLAPAIALSMDLDPIKVGLLITIHSAGASLAYLPAGIVGDFFRNRGMLLTITFWWVAIGYFLAAEATNFWVLAVLLGLAGLGDAAWHPLATGAMVEQMPKRRAHVLGIHALGGTFAEVGAPLMAGLLLGYFSWQTVLQISTIPAFVLAVLFLHFRHRVPTSRGSQLTRQDLRSMLSLWITPGALRVIGIIVFYNMSLMGVMAMMPLYMQNSQGLSAAETGLMFAGIWTVGAIAQPILGHLSDTTGRKMTTVFGLLWASGFMAAVSFVTELYTLVTLFVLSIAALVGIRAVLLAAMLDLSGKRETTTLGFAFAIMDGVGALGALLAGVAGQVELRYAFVFCACTAFAAMLLTAMHCFSKSEE